MSERPEKSSEILGALPRTRPQRRSSKRGPASDESKNSLEAGIAGDGPPAGARPPKDTPSPPARPRASSPPPPVAPPPKRPGLAKTFVQAGAELAEIGLSVAARAVRDTVSRLPRP